MHRDQTLEDPLDGDLERSPHTHRGQEVIEIVPTKQRGSQSARPPRGADEGTDPLKVIRRSHRSHIRLSRQPVRDHSGTRHLAEPLARRVIQVDDGRAALLPEHREELSLGGEIVFHRFVEVEVILGQVGEDGDVKGTLRHPMQHQGVGGDLYNGGVRPLTTHPPEERLQIRGLRGGPLCLAADPPAPVLDRPDNPGPVAAGLERRLDQIAHGRLAIGPRDPRETQLM